jgi:hypothetical protein
MAAMFRRNARQEREYEQALPEGKKARTAHNDKSANYRHVSIDWALRPETDARPRFARPTLVALGRTQGAAMPQVAQVTFDGCNELDSSIAASEGNIATASGCLASQYLAARTITRTIGEAAARAVIDHVAPVGENAETVERAMRTIGTGEPALR